MVLPPWEQTWGAPCHVHGLMAAGALSADGTRWMEAAPRFLLPVRALSTVLRGTCCAALAQEAPGACPTPGLPALGPPAGCAQRRAPLSAKAWGV